MRRGEIIDNDITKEHYFLLILFECPFYLVSFDTDANHYDSDSRPFNLSSFYERKKRRTEIERSF